MEEPLTSRNFTNILLALTEVYTQCFLISQQRFTDLIEYSQNHNKSFDQEANLVIESLTHNSPAEIKFNVDASPEGLAKGFQTIIDAITQWGKRRKEADLRNKILEEEIERKKRESESDLADKDQVRRIAAQKSLLELEEQLLILQRKKVENEYHKLNQALELTKKATDILYPEDNSTIKAMATQSMLNNILKLGEGKGLELILPAEQNGAAESLDTGNT